MLQYYFEQLNSAVVVKRPNLLITEVFSMPIKMIWEACAYLIAKAISS